MIVPPELQDLPETMAPESSASSSARDNGDDHHTPSSSSSSSEATPSRGERTGDAAPKDLPVGFRFKAALHHEVVDCAPSISGYRKLKEMVRAYHIPRTILLRTGGHNERPCTVSQTGWIPVYVDHFDIGLRFPLPGLVFNLLADYELALTQLTPNSIRFIIGFMLLCARLEVPAKAIVFRSLFQCRLCPKSRGAKWYYLSGREKRQLFKNVKNKVARWKRQFIFVRDTRTERISNNLAARLSEWRVPNAHVNYPQLLPRDTDLKNRLLEHARSKNLIDLEVLVTPELLAVFGFVDVANLFNEAYSSASVNEPRAHEVEEQATPRRDRRGSTSGRLQRLNRTARHIEDRARCPDNALTSGLRLRPSVHASVHASHTAAARSSNASSATMRAADLASALASMSGPKIAYPDGFNYVKPECLPAMAQGMQSFVPPTDRQRAKAFVQQHGGQVVMVKLMDAFSYAVALFESEQGARTQNSELSANYKQLAAEKASLVDDVNHLQGSEMANRAATAESRVEELAAREEAARVEERAKKAKADRDRAQHELSSLRHQVAEADRNLNAAEEALNELKTSHGRSIYNEIRGKVLRHRPDFPIGELAFFDGDDLDEQGKSLAPPADATVRLRWDLNEEGVPVWPPSILKEGEDPTGLPSFDAWVEGAPVAKQEPSSTSPNSQPAVVPTSSPVNAPDPEPAALSPPAHSSPLAADASMLVDLTAD
ncbi:hypothetical protein SLEP1_g29610 [Rubroshorea leprosula]|uniref:Transposase (putative) gypsy type domain-containing protein n=1 Tax=Rubroshorea leprosula TaxID=152421 RepID=A0AAV5JZY0_9ROSI|nr:hypothetical protein SLEP1_g29610 [Rubroshorea leprosula]